jgi:hypothetical protein
MAALVQLARAEYANRQTKNIRGGEKRDRNERVSTAEVR